MINALIPAFYLPAPLAIIII